MVEWRCYLLVAIWLLKGDASRPPFFDYDCACVKQRLTVADWNGIHREVEAAVQSAQKGGPWPRPPRLSGRLLLQQAEEAAQECPLGLLNLAIVHFYTAAFESTEESTDPLVSERHRKEVMQISAHVADSLASEFPVHVICSSRWPVFEAIEIFTLKMDKDIAGVPGNACDDIVGGAVDWKKLRWIAGHWSRMQFTEGSRSPEVVKLLLLIDNFVDEASTKQAELECPIGTAFLAAVQAASAVVQFTHNFDKHSNVLDKVIHEGLLSAVSCGWPLGHALAVLSDSNKARRYADRNYKYLRNYADLDLHVQELSPLVAPPTSGSDTVAWHKRAAKKAAAIARVPWHSFARVLLSKAAGRGRVFRQALNAIQELTGGRREKSRGRQVALTLLYGHSWSSLLQRLVSHLCRLGFAWPLLVVSIGQEAYEVRVPHCTSSWQACRHLRKSVNLKVSCWRPNTESQVHRFTIVHILLHLGVDVFYFDMDAFFLQNPLPAVLSQARMKNHETIFASHGDGDCINIGVFYIKSTIRTTMWFSQFLEWYYEHQYEIDQRGLDVLLGSPLRIPDGVLGVSFPPKNLPKVRVGVMEDENKVVIGFIGWYGHISKMDVFHWCNSHLDEKWEELDAVYKAAEAVQDWMPLSLALSVVSTLDFQVLPREPSEEWSVVNTGKPPLPGSSVWKQVGQARRVFEAYRLPKPLERLPCW
ncbi:unnamed protein product [Durusdinium trenchii]|uniref:Nucleotide-diphospho-sugar transferase domain-containing protein n=1 Tax=Durusdinium trenchii TaxID=1381693 RepID=A0ABP0KID3_9DINO